MYSIAVIKENDAVIAIVKSYNEITLSYISLKCYSWAHIDQKSQIIASKKHFQKFRGMENTMDQSSRENHSCIIVDGGPDLLGP